MLRWLLPLLVAATPVFAGPDRLSLMFGSHHLGAKDDFEEINPGVFLTWERPQLAYTVGVFRNSYGRISQTAIASFPIFRQGEFLFAAFGGLAHYPEDGRHFIYHVGDVVPLIGLQARYRSIFVQALPLDGKVGSAVVTFGLSIPLK